VAKRRETALNFTRKQLSKGIGSTEKVEKTETQIITEVLDEQHPQQHTDNLKSGEVAKREDDWDAGWSDDEGKGDENSAANDKGKDNEKSSSEATDSEDNSPEEGSNWTAGVVKEAVNDDDDVADAWGWGDEDVEEGAEKIEEKQVAVPEKTEMLESQSQKMIERTVTMVEEYTISSIPKPVFDTVKQIIDDGEKLTSEE
jgi:centromere/kinetochore protein ZW10